jgi:hypothetical protein
VSENEPQHTLIIRDRNSLGQIIGERAIIAHSMDEALALSSLREMTFDGHLCKDVLRTQTGVDVKTFCNLKFVVPIGPEGSSERESFMARGVIPVNCWKCKDRR